MHDAIKVIHLAQGIYIIGLHLYEVVLLTCKTQHMYNRPYHIVNLRIVRIFKPVSKLKFLL